MFRQALFSLGLATAFWATSLHAAGVDITKAVLSKTEIARVLNDKCDLVAAGNEKRCELEAAVLETLGPTNQIRIHATIGLLSRHRVNSNFVAYSTKAKAFLDILIDASTCRVARVSLDSDSKIYDALFSVVESEVRRAIVKAVPTC